MKRQRKTARGGFSLSLFAFRFSTGNSASTFWVASGKLEQMLERAARLETW
jgi:hypothetical protein